MPLFPIPFAGYFPRLPAAFLFLFLAGGWTSAATVIVTVTQKTPLESVSSAGDVTGVTEAQAGAQYTFVSFASGQVTMKDTSGLYRISIGATDYVPPPASPETPVPPPVSTASAGLAPAPDLSVPPPSQATPDPFATRLPPWSPEAEKAWWTAHPTLTTEGAGAHEIHDQLAADYQKIGSSVFTQSDFQNWLDVYSWVELGVGSAPLLSKPDNFATFVALGQDDEISHLVVEKMKPGDKGPGVLALLLRLAQANAADLHEYAALGVAYALVFDAPFPVEWPHGQVAHSAVPFGDADPVARFQFYVAANRAHQLDNDLTELGVDELKFVVDSRISLAELTWAQQNAQNIAYSHFADAFFAIHYDKSRIQGDSVLYNWQFPAYRLQDIRDAGGICIDQAYFASMVGKARGIPTIVFTGLGDEGAHAWFGYLDRSGAWQLDCGRYENQDFAKGYTQDPQTWTELKDTDLQQMVKNGVKDPNYPGAHAALSWAYLLGNNPAAKAAFEDAHTIMPNLAETWRAEADYLDHSNASIDDLKTFYTAWITQVGPFPDQKVAAQRMLVAELRKANDPSADTVEQDIILENRNGGVDLAVEGAQEAIEDHFKVKDWDGARLEFERAVRDFADDGGATFFYRLVEPYWRRCMAQGQIDLAGKALHFTEERTSFSQLGPDGKMTQIGENLAAYKKMQAQIEAGVAAMQDWLQQIDNGQEGQAWNSATAAFQANEPVDKWSGQVRAARQKMGGVKSRDLVMASVGDSIRLNGSIITGTFVMAKFSSTGDLGLLREIALFQDNGTQGWQAQMYSGDASVWPASAVSSR